MNQRQRQNIIAAIAAGVGIVLILSAAWLFTREHRFRSYTSKKYGFSIKYPALWAYEENVAGAAVIFLAPLESELDFLQESVNVVVQDFSNNPMNLKEYSNLAIEQMEAVFKDKMITIESGPTFFAGRAGYKLIYVWKSTDGDYQYMVAWTLDGTTSYQVTLTTFVSKYEKYISKYKRMLKSFRIH